MEGSAGVSVFIIIIIIIITTIIKWLRFCKLQLWFIEHTAISWPEPARMGIQKRVCSSFIRWIVLLA